jgi:hypothetical protein
VLTLKIGQSRLIAGGRHPGIGRIKKYKPVIGRRRFNVSLLVKQSFSIIVMPINVIMGLITGRALKPV